MLGANPEDLKEEPQLSQYANAALERGYAIIRDVVSPDLAELAADAITDKSKVVVKMEKWRQFEISKQAEAVVEDFVRHARKEEIMELRGSQTTTTTTPLSIALAEFLPTEIDPAKVYKSPRSDLVFVTIALTPLRVQNGWMVLLGGSHRDLPKPWPRISLDLNPGDAVAFHGGLSYFHSAGGGGKFLTLTYSMN